MTAVTVEEIIAAIVARLERVKASGDEVGAVCPLPAHEDNNPSFSINARNGLWNCHGCGRKGNAHQLARELGCLPSGVRRHSRTTPSVDWGLDEAMSKYGVTVTDKAVVFRITDHNGAEHRRHVRYHRGDPRFQFWDKDSGKQTYHAWCAWDLVREWGANSGIAFIVEGDRDALTLAAHGYPGIGILGTGHFDKAVEDIVRALKAAGIGALVLTPDNDEPGIEAVSVWASKLAALGFVTGIRTLPESICGAVVKDAFDAFYADRRGFAGLLFQLPVTWRGE